MRTERDANGFAKAQETAQPEEGSFSDGSGSEAETEKIDPPFGDQRFDSFDQWVAYATSWLTCHIDYNNTEHGETKGWRGNHFTALCFDSFGRRCRIGADMHRARDEGAFPVWWIWPDQIVEIISRAPKISPLPSTARRAGRG